MREIKFRGKDCKTDKWVYGYYWAWEQSHKPKEESVSCIYEKHYFIRITEDKNFTDIEIHPDSKGQYTGLKDKNGKEIFQGDIVNCLVLIEHRVPSTKRQIIEERHEKRIIRFQNGAFRQFPLNDNSYGWTLRDFDVHDIKFEVIGNIYENPELIKEGK
jgi:uncharacterized phage protein (TIGR01671 family)